MSRKPKQTRPFGHDKVVRPTCALLIYVFSFYFELFNVLFAFTLGSSVFDLATAFFKDPQQALIILETLMPQNAPFFINYLLCGIAILAFEILQINRLAWQACYYLFVIDKTPRALFNLKNKPVSLEYGLWYPTMLLSFIIGL